MGSLDFPSKYLILSSRILPYAMFQYIGQLLVRVNMKLTNVVLVNQARGNENEESAKQAQEKEAQKAAERKRKKNE